MDKGLLRRALADSEEPTPGYMFREIAQWTFIDQKTQQKLLAYLISCLVPASSVHVLAKTLKVIKHVCENGHSDFQNEMQRRSDELRAYSLYRGPLDPKYGDKLNEKVRTNAKEAIDSAFSHRRDNRAPIGLGHGQDSTDSTWKPEGFQTGMSTGSSGPTANAHMAPMPTTNKWAEHMARGGKPEEAGWFDNVKSGISTGFGLWKENIKTPEERMREELASGAANYQPIQLESGFSSAPSEEPPTEWKFPSQAEPAGPTAFTAEPTKLVTPTQQEVQKIAAMSSTPLRIDLQQFVTKITQLIQSTPGAGFPDVAEALDERLSNKYAWQQRLNALTVVEYLLRSNVSDDVRSYFSENPEDVQRNVHVVQASLKEKAQKVLKLLGIPERGTAQTEQQLAKAEQITAPAFGTGIQWSAGMVSGQGFPAPAEPAAPEPEPGAGTGEELNFAGMQIKGSKKEKSHGDKTKLSKRKIVQQDDSTEDVWGAVQSGPMAMQQKQKAKQAAGWQAPSLPPPQPQPPKQQEAFLQMEPAPAKPQPRQEGAWGDMWGTPPQAPQAQAQPQPQAPAWGTAWGDTAAPAPKPQPQQQSRGPLDVDDFFSGPAKGPSAQHVPQWGSSVVPPDPHRTHPAAAAPTASSTTFDINALAPPPAGGGAPWGAPPVHEQQVTQADLQRLNEEMQRTMAEIPTNPSAMARAQALMQQSQAMMLRLQQQQQHPAPMPAQPVAHPQPSMHSSGPSPPAKHHNQLDANLAQYAELMKRSMKPSA